MPPRKPDAEVTFLPIAGQEPAERADAARNRRALLDAAHRIVTTEGLDGLSLDRLAREAGVGVGTVYRRFGDRGGLAAALLDHRERRFQEALLTGPPPLGPDAPPPERLRAFLHTYLDRLEEEVELRTWGEAKDPFKEYGTGAYQATRALFAALLDQAGVEGDIDYLADALLATTRASLFYHLRRDRGISLDRMKAGVDQLLDGLLPHP